MTPLNITLISYTSAAAAAEPGSTEQGVICARCRVIDHGERRYCAHVCRGGGEIARLPKVTVRRAGHATVRRTHIAHVH